MKKMILTLVLVFGFSGCSFLEGVTPEKIETVYGTAKVIYADIKHVVYEIEEEKKRIKEDGLGEKSNSNN